MDSLKYAIRDAVSRIVDTLPEDRRNAIYGSIYEILGTDAHDRDNPFWGEHHRRDNIMLLADLAFIARSL